MVIQGHGAVAQQARFNAELAASKFIQTCNNLDLCLSAGKFIAIK